MSFYGDSAQGMVESALEFANICRKLDFHNFVFSMKASNPVVMVKRTGCWRRRSTSWAGTTRCTWA